MSTIHDAEGREHNDRAVDGQRATHSAVYVASQLREEILRGAFDFTQRLPPERELAERFGASRGTIRAALARLQNMNLVVSRQGSGTYVNHGDQDDLQTVVEVTSPLELIECRMGIEPHLARLAVANAGKAPLKRMLQTLEAAEAAGSDPDGFSSADEQFHLALAECADNPLLLWIYRRINDIRHQTQWSARKDHVLTPRRIEDYNRQHRELYAAIRSRDVHRAVDVITAHLEKARKQLLGLETE